MNRCVRCSGTTREEPAGAETKEATGWRCPGCGMSGWRWEDGDGWAGGAGTAYGDASWRTRCPEGLLFVAGWREEG